MSKGHGRTIAKYEMDKVLSERGSLIIYLEKVRCRCFLPPYFSSLPCSLCIYLYLTFIFRFLTHNQKKSFLGFIRIWKWASYNQRLCLSMNTMSVSLRETICILFPIDVREYNTVNKQALLFVQVFNISFIKYRKNLFQYLSLLLQENIVCSSTIQRGKEDSYGGSAEVIYAHVLKVNGSKQPYPSTVNFYLFHFLF